MVDEGVEMGVYDAFVFWRSWFLFAHDDIYQSSL